MQRGLVQGLVPSDEEDHRTGAQRSHVKMEVKAGHVQPQPRDTKDEPSTADNQEESDLSP